MPNLDSLKLNIITKSTLFCLTFYTNLQTAIFHGQITWKFLSSLYLYLLFNLLTSLQKTFNLLHIITNVKY